MSDTRKAYLIRELPPELVEALENVEYGPVDPGLEKLMAENQEKQEPIQNIADRDKPQ